MSAWALRTISKSCVEERVILVVSVPKSMPTTVAAVAAVVVVILACRRRIVMCRIVLSHDRIAE